MTINEETLNLQLDLSKPLYEQILYQIRYAVARKDIALGSRLPSVRELAQQLRVNPNTVMRAYQELNRDEIIETRRGQGTFITTKSHKIQHIRNNMAAEAIKSFTDTMKELGIERQAAISLLEEGEW
ncbi:MAG TPA: GntR family transcriptional regulator [Desulfosporosinus sp.]|nr:GntR family transcriptional regulator [Desulfosporosinus sp.]